MQRYIPPIDKTLLIVNVLLFAATYLIKSLGVNLEVVLGAFFRDRLTFSFIRLSPTCLCMADLHISYSI